MGTENNKKPDYYKEMWKNHYTSWNLQYHLQEFLRNITTNDYVRAFLLGCLHTLIFAPFNVLPVIFISYSGLLYLISCCFAKRTAIRIGWWCGFGHFLSSLYWIHYAFLVEVDKFAYMIPFAVLLLPMILAFTYAFVAWAAFSITSSRLRRLLVFASAVTIAEMARTYFYLPFPWNLTGHSIAYYDYFLQSSFYLGVFGLSFLLSLVGGVFYLRSRKAVTICLLSLVAFTLFGFARVEYADNVNEITDYSVRIVQPYNQHHLGDESKKIEALENLLNLSVMQRPDDLKYIIWAESAFPYAFYEGSRHVKPLSYIVPKGGMLLFGADRIEFKDERGDSFDIYNSLIGIDDSAGTMFTYDKSILVPFGEYIPFKNILSKVSKVVGGIYDFSTGPGDAIVKVQELPSFTPFICYETIFPYWGENASELLIDVTNNIWFGNSIGPHQHFAMVKFKAAEVGKPMIRVANNGISAVINKFGVITEEINLNDKSFRDVYIPGGKFEVSFYFVKILISSVPFFMLFFAFYFERRIKKL